MLNEKSKLEKKRISILGCGWLGLPLAKRLLQTDISYHVKGSTTSPERLELLNKEGIEGFLFNLNPGFTAPDSTIAHFFEADTLVISLPPRLSKSEPGHYLKQVENVITKIKDSSVKEIIFLSSTGIYPELNRVVHEADVTTPEQSASEEMVAAENMITALRPGRSVSVLRLAGLIGLDRIPGKYVKGKKELTTGSLPVNYIHPEDAVLVMATMIEKHIHNETFNIVAPLHPTRREVYDSNCAQFGWEVPTYSEPAAAPDFKIISGEKLSKFYDVNFKFPNPMQFHYELME
ncbi:MAG TPA: NAD-dependent dehydratase [Dyadobacter sp.]|jgi:nucleoside-diphosphate-sugar epimerase|nr:NAD-dependent dehydratase [Dyadobacter sp.]